MTWLKIDDNFAEHPKILELPSDAVRWFHLRAMSYSARYRTRGEITPAAFKALAGKPSYAAALVAACLWDTTSRGGWAIHDFEVYNPTRERPEDPGLSQKRADAGRVGGQRSGEARRSKPEANDEANDEANLLQGRSKTEASPHAGAAARAFPSRPVPSPTPTEAIASSGVGVASPPDDTPDAVPISVREIRDSVLLALPSRWQADRLTVDEAEQFARDYDGKHADVANAIAEFRRQETGLPFPQKLRKYMPALPGERRNGNGTNNGNGNRLGAQPKLGSGIAQGTHPGRAPDAVI